MPSKKTKKPVEDKTKIDTKNSESFVNSSANELNELISKLNDFVININENNQYEILKEISDPLEKLMRTIDRKLKLFRQQFAKKELTRIFRF